MILMKTSKVEAFAKAVVDYERPMELGLFLVEKAIALDTTEVSRTTILRIRRVLQLCWFSYQIRLPNFIRAC